MLCGKCETITFTPIRELGCADLDADEGYLTHHANKTSFEESRARGCHLWSLLWSPLFEMPRNSSPKESRLHDVLNLVPEAVVITSRGYSWTVYSMDTSGDLGSYRLPGLCL
jgi:hypothetical protein